MIEAHFMDKSEWGKGPWQKEPDHSAWSDPTTGYQCVTRRGNEHIGCWCGYVAVPRSHPFYLLPWYECMESLGCDRYCEHSVMAMVDVHGGLTYSGHLLVDLEMEPCENEYPGWYYGFDCGHSGDLCPAMVAFEKKMGMTPSPSSYVYRNLTYVRVECASLAMQLETFA